MAEEYNKKSDEHEYERKTGDYEEGSKDRGFFDFLGKKEKEKPTSYHKEDTAVPVEKVYEEEHHHQAPAPVVHHHEEPTDSPTEENKGFLVKINEKLPGHKKTDEVPVGAASHEQHSDDHHAAEPPVAASYEAGKEPKKKKGILEKIKEKLPGYHSKTEEVRNQVRIQRFLPQHSLNAAEPPVAASYKAGEVPKEKKGILEKIKEKLLEYHSKTEEVRNQARIQIILPQHSLKIETKSVERKTEGNLICCKCF